MDARAVAAELESLQACSGGMIRLLTLAPELPGALELIAAARSLDRVALRPARRRKRRCCPPSMRGRRTSRISSTPAQGCITASRASSARRSPTIASPSSSSPTACIWHPRAIDIALRCKPPEKVVLVSDGVAAVACRRARSSCSACAAWRAMRCVQATGQLAGSRLTLDRAVRNLREVSSHRSSVCCVGRALRRRRCSA